MKYAVLRDLQQTRISSEDWLRPGLRQYEGTSSGSVPVPRVDVEETDAKGAFELAREPGVVAAEPVMPLYLIEPVGIGEPTALGNSWGVEAVGAVESDYTGADTVVAVLDTGIDAAHPAFAGMTIIEKDFSGSGNGDTQGHGTHCAGTIVGRDVNGDRIGIARGVQRILVGKVFDDSGAGSSEMLFTALQWAVANHTRVVSMSLGFDFTGMVSQQVQQGWPADLATSLALELYRRNLRMFDALMAMIRAQEGANPGCVVVAAAGNESKRDIKPDYQIAVSLPAAADGVLSIGAVGRSPDGYVIAPFSNSNPRLCAPGVDIKSASPGGGLCIKSGTSMACPHTAGVAALWWEAAREMGLPFNAKTVIARIEASCRLDGLNGISALDRGQGMVSAP